MQVVARIIGVLPSQLSRMRARGWKAANYASMSRPMPADFAIQQAHMTFTQLGAHYRCGNTTLLRWFDALPANVRRPSLRGAHLRREG